MKKIFAISALVLFAACGKNMSIRVNGSTDSNQTAVIKDEAKIAQKCIDLTGSYTTTDDDGDEVTGTYTQTACEKIEFDFSDEEFHQVYLLDGNFHDQVSAKAENDAILVEIKASYSDGEIEAVDYIGARMVITKDAATGNLLMNVKRYDKDGKLTKEEDKVLKKVVK